MSREAMPPKIVTVAMHMLKCIRKHMQRRGAEPDVFRNGMAAIVWSAVKAHVSPHLQTPIQCRSVLWAFKVTRKEAESVFMPCPVAVAGLEMDHQGAAFMIARKRSESGSPGAQSASSGERDSPSSKSNASAAQGTEEEADSPGKQDVKKKREVPAQEWTYKNLCCEDGVIECIEALGEGT